MKNKTTYHSHCSFCDGHAPMEEFVKSAIREGFTSYGISSHAPLPFSTRWTMDAADMPAYLEEFVRVKSLYGTQIELYVGLEIDYLDDYNHPAADYFQALPLDYRIGSIHMLKGVSGEYIDIDCCKEAFRETLRTHFEDDLDYVLRSYYSSQVRMLELGGFDILGHCDKINSRAAFCRPGLLEEPWFSALMTDFFDLVAESGVMVEINTKKFLPEGLFFPHKDYLKELFLRDIPVQVNSDAHFVGKLNDGRPEALRLLYEAGYRTVRERHGNQWTDVPIDGDVYA